MFVRFREVPLIYPMHFLIAMLFGTLTGFFFRIFNHLPCGTMARDGQRTREWLCSLE
jgi:hypothetical protein